MKNIILFLFSLFTVPAFALPGIHEALKNPSVVTALKFCGEKEEAGLFVKNAFRFTALTHIQLSGISDSLIAEHAIVAIAACPNVTKVSFDKCGFTNLSGAVKMLVSVKEIEINNCTKLNIDRTFSTVSTMPSLKSITYSTTKLDHLPQSFITMRGLQKISFHNTDLSLADGYALNTSSRESLVANEKLELGFGSAMLVLEYSCYDKISAKEHINLMRDMLQGVAGMNAGVALPQRSKGFTREHPLVKPPIAGLDIRKNVYTTDAATGGMIEYPSGTRIFVPEHAFVDANGKSIDGNVTIDYREYRDQVDILVSGIPMTYDSAGQKGNFESAGMFEINASVDGKEVFLAPGKKVDLEFAVVDTAANYNFYSLDEKKGWVYQENLGKTDNSADNINEDQDYFSAFAFRRRTQLDLSRMPRSMDTASVDYRYADLSYSYMSKDKNYITSAGKKIIKASHWSLRKVINKKGYCCFKINRRYRSGHNPEMSAFSNVLWKTTDNVRSKELRRLFRKKNGVNDLRIYYDGNGFQLEFKTFDGFKTISATPVRMFNDSLVEISPSIIRSRYKLYSRMLEQRKKSVVKDIKHNKNYVARWKKKLSADSVRHWKRLRPTMSENQKAMTYGEWIAFARKAKFNSSVLNPAYSLASAGQQYNAQAYQRLSTFKFGIFNCDHTLPLPEPVEVFAFCNVDGVRNENISTIYLLDQKKNMTIAYEANGNSGPLPIAFGKTHSYALVAVSADGKVSVGDVNAFNERKHVDVRICSFETTSVSDQPLTTAELRELILNTR